VKRDYLGDSYDAVKRLWQQILAGWAPLYAEPRFIPNDLRQDFTRLTGIPILAEQQPAPFSILNDPDTGIRLPGEENQAESRTHIAMTTIVSQMQSRSPRCVITFDQSDYRNSDLQRDQQRQVKLRFLRDQGIPAFYFVSHAPFLFAFPDDDALLELEGRLSQAGIPTTRFEKVR
jgi:hypothetical protein